MKRVISTFIATAASALTGYGAIITGTVSDFTGPDDLLLDPATNVVAVDLNGRSGSLDINGVTFQSDFGGPVTSGGATVATTAANEIAAWSGVPSYVGGDAASVDNLETVMRSIRWNAAPNLVTTDISGLTPGTFYNVQLLFSENGSGADRHWDIGVDGVLAVDDFSNAGTTTTTGRVYSGTFEPGADGTLNIVMGQEPLGGDPNNTAAMGADNNPILQAVIVHTVPEPSSLALVGLGFLSLLARRRR